MVFSFFCVVSHVLLDRLHTRPFQLAWSDTDSMATSLYLAVILKSLFQAFGLWVAQGNTALNCGDFVFSRVKS